MKKKKKLDGFLGCFFICFFILFTYIVLGTVTYESNDDEVMNLIAAGAFGKNNGPYLIFTNFIYGKFVGFLYNICPKLNMYLFLMVFLNFAAVFTVSYLVFLRINSLLEKNGKTLSNLDYTLLSCGVSTVVGGLLATEYFASLQFSKNAGLYTAVGFAVLYIWFKEKKSFKNCLWILGVLFLWLGYAVRDYAFYSACLECMAVLFGVFLVNIKSHINNFKNNKFKVIKDNYCIPVLFVILILGFFTLKGVNDKAYSKTEWKEFLEFNRYRAELTDYYMMPFDEHIDELSEIGFSVNDYIMFYNWIFADKDNFSTDTLKKVAEIRGNEGKKLTLNPKSILRAVSELESKGLSRVMCAVWIVILLGLCLMGDGKNIIIFAISTGGILAEYWYLLCIGRVIWRAEMMAWVAAIITFLTVASYELDFSVNVKRGMNNFKRACIALTLAGILFVRLCSGVYNFNIGKGRHFYVQTNIKYEMYTGLDKDNLYVFTLAVTVPSTVDDIAKINRYLYEDYFYNVTFTGGWTVSSPFQKNTLDRYGVDENVISSLITNDNVYLVDAANSEMYKTIGNYLQEKFEGTVSAEEVGNVNGNIIYKYSLK